ncbi:MAG: LapA family protein [candidate division Zixibacteria bacterium]
MWIIKYALSASVLLAFMYFSFTNATETTTVRLFQYQFESVRVILVIYAAFAFGVIFWFFVSIFQYFKVTGRLSDYKRKNRQLTEEIKALRNLPIEEAVPQDVNEGEPGGAEEPS